MDFETSSESLEGRVDAMEVVTLHVTHTCDLICQHAKVAHQFSEQLWTEYHRTVHGHVPATLRGTQEVITR